MSFTGKVDQKAAGKVGKQEALKTAFLPKHKEPAALYSPATKMYLLLFAVRCTKCMTPVMSRRGIAHLSIMASELGGAGGRSHDIVLRALRVDCCVVLWLTGHAMATGVPVGLPWYRRSDYAALLALFTDPEKLPATFDEWLSHAESVEKQLRTAGLAVVRVSIRPGPFEVWCKQQGLLPDQRARLSFANEVARQHRGQPE